MAADQTEPVVLPADVLRRGRRWAQLADLQASAVAKVGRLGVAALITAVAALLSMLLNVAIVIAGSGTQALRDLPVYTRPVIITVMVAPLAILPMMSLLEHLRRLSQAYRYQAEHDPLTGVYNRNGLNHRAVSLGPGTLVVLADVDDFKSVNDKYGHVEGDKVLLAVVGTLRRLFGKDAEVARVGGDEFVVLLATEPAESIAVPSEVLVSTGLASVRVSLGTARLETVLEIAIGEADLAMYRSKVRPQGQVEPLDRQGHRLSDN